MKTDLVHNLCEDLDKLLKDICEFLSDGINNTNLTENQRLFANKLIERSKKQLQQISTVLSTPESDDAYVDMSPQAVSESEGTYEETYVIKCAGAEEISCPYDDLPAVKMEECGKFGFLDRKGKIFFIGHHKKIYAGIKNNWLLIYSCKKDTKPIDCLNLSLFTAKPVDTAKTKAFELSCIKTHKIYQFVAQTPKDMMQWLSCINKCTSCKEVSDQNNVSLDEDINPYEAVTHEEDIKVETRKKTVTKPLPPLPPSNTEATEYLPPKGPHNTKDKINDIEEEEDLIYSELIDYRIQPAKKIQNSNNYPPTKLREIKTDSQNTNSFEDTDSVYDLPVRPATEFFLNKLQAKMKDKDYSNTRSMQKHPRIDQIPTESQMTDSFSEVEDDIYDLIEKQPIPRQERNSLKSQSKNTSKQNSQINERGSQLTIDSFSEPDEDQTYDVPENLLPSSKPLLNLLQKNVSFQISSMKTAKDVEEADGEYCNLVKRENDIVKDDVNKDNDDEDVEYDSIITKKPANSFNILRQKMEKLAPPLKPKPTKNIRY